MADGSAVTTEAEYLALEEYSNPLRILNGDAHATSSANPLAENLPLTWNTEFFDGTNYYAVVNGKVDGSGKGLGYDTGVKLSSIYKPNTFKNDNKEVEKTVTVGADTTVISFKINQSNFSLTKGEYEKMSAAEKQELTVSAISPYLAWISQDIAKVSAQPDAGYYVKSMYALINGGDTRYPVYANVNTCDGNDAKAVIKSDGTAVFVTDIPTDIYVEYTPGEDETREISVVKFYMDFTLNSTADFIANPSAAGKLITDAGFTTTFFNPASVMFSDTETDGSGKHDVTITYSENEWASSAANAYKVVLGSARAENLTLSYDISSRDKFTNTKASQFRFVSSDESIASVVNYTDDSGKLCGLIMPGGELLGSENTVDIYLQVFNGVDQSIIDQSAEQTNVSQSTQDDWFTVKANSLYFEKPAGDGSYISIPRIYKEVMAVQNRSADILFSTNLLGEFTFNVYRTNGAGLITDNVPVYSSSAVGTKDNKVIRFTVPENTLSALSVGGNYTYRAVVSSVQDGTEYSAYALIRVKSVPVSVYFERLNSYSFASGKSLDFAFTVNDLNPTGGEFTYSLLRNSDKTVVDSAAAYKTASDLTDGKYALTVSSDKLTVAGGKLKEAYILTVSARGSSSDNWTTESMLFYIYNAEAIDIMVRAFTTGKSVGGSGNSYTLNNAGYLNGLTKNTDGTVALENGITLATLQQDVNLAAFVSLNYGSYVWSLISDRMEWYITDSGNAGSDNADLYAEQAGIYSDIDASLIKTYMPLTDLVVVGHADDTVTVKAVHAESGIETSVEIKIDTMLDKFALFQFVPKTTTQVSYTDGKGNLRTVASNSKGELAVYEPNGFASDISFLSEYEGDVYLGTLPLERLLSDEQNTAMKRIYPLNIFKLAKVSEAVIYLTEPDGSAYVGDVAVRGGVYKNWSGTYQSRFDETGSLCTDTSGYLDKADLLTEKAGDGNTAERANDKSNGRTEQTFTTDKNGALHIYFDTTQFYNAAGELFATDSLKFVFELKFKDDKYLPAVIEIEPADNGGRRQAQGSIIMRDNTFASPSPFIDTQSLGNGNGLIDISGFTYRDAVGTNKQYPSVSVNYRNLLWGSDLIAGTAENYAYSVFPEGKTINDYKAELNVRESEDGNSDLEDGDYVTGQSYFTYIYPFSSIPVNTVTYAMNSSTLADFIPSYDDVDYLEINFYTDTDSSAEQNWEKQNCISIDYQFVNLITKPEPQNDEKFQNSAKELGKGVTENFDMSKILAGAVPAGDLLSAAMGIFMGYTTGGAYTVSITMVPTADPRVLNAIIFIGDPEEAPQTTVAQEVGFSTSNDFSDWKELAGKKSEEDAEEKGVFDPFSVSFSGMLIVSVRYTADGSWSILPSGGTLKASFFINKSYTQNFICGPVPVTVSFGASARFSLMLGLMHYYEIIEKAGDYKEIEFYQTLMDIGIKLGVNAFAGVGVDYSIVALKIGIVGKVGAGINVVVLADNGYYVSEYEGAGSSLELTGSIGLQFVAKILCVSYEKTFGSIELGVDVQFGDYDNITEHWSGITTGGSSYTAYRTAGDIVCFEKDYIKHATKP